MQIYTNAYNITNERSWQSKRGVREYIIRTTTKARNDVLCVANINVSVSTVCMLVVS